MSKRKEKTYDMKFIPLDDKGMRKKGCPYIGEDRGHEDGDIVEHPLELRHEAWWELVDESKVPKAALERDQKKRERFMVKARASEAARAKQLARDASPAVVT